MEGARGTPMPQRATLADAEAMDRADALAPLRDRFELPAGIIYLDGNSLGALPKAVKPRIDEVVATQWGEGLIRSWNTYDWIDLPARVGARIGKLIGAEPDTVVVADSTSVNLFKALAAALSLRRGRDTILTERGNFPTDGYIASGTAELFGRKVRFADPANIVDALDDSVAVLTLTEVNYRTGARHDMAALTAKAHAAGALVVWDLAHSAGALPVDLTAADADFAVGCGYKYLNGGPGAPAFVYVAPRHLEGLRQPLTGWLGHAAPFDFADDYQPAAGIDAMRVGTPAILSMSALNAALDAFEGVDIAALKQKSDRMFDLFTAEVAAVAPELELITPTDAAQRGSQASFRLAEGYAAMQALIARGVIGDFRGPDIMRLGFAPLYLRFADVWRAAAAIGEVMRNREWNRAEFKTKAKVV
jgi:kynureninase